NPADPTDANTNNTLDPSRDQGPAITLELNGTPAGVKPLRPLPFTLMTQADKLKFIPKNWVNESLPLSGDHCGPKAPSIRRRWGSKMCVTWVSPEPSAFMTKMSLARVMAMDFPSGDHVGSVPSMTVLTDPLSAKTMISVLPLGGPSWNSRIALLP